MKIRNISTWILHLKTNTSEKLEQVMACKQMADVADGYRMLIFVHIRYDWSDMNNFVTHGTVTICAHSTIL